MGKRVRIPMKTILFPTDFSVYSEKAREYALAFARKWKAHVYVIHALEFLYEINLEDPQIQSWCQSIIDEFESKLQNEVNLFRDYGIDVKGELIIGISWKVILSFAHEKDVDLVILGSHGLRTEEGRFLLGTTSHKVALMCSKPVLIIRSDQEGDVL